MYGVVKVFKFVASWTHLSFDENSNHTTSHTNCDESIKFSETYDAKMY